MQSGNKYRLRFERVEDASVLSDFICGLDVMDQFIHSGLQWCIDYHYFNLAGCQFLTVEAYSRGEASAVGFYSRCDFIAAEEPNPNKETLRMYKTILPIVQFDEDEEEDKC